MDLFVGKTTFLRRRRREIGLRLEDVAEGINMSEATVYAIEMESRGIPKKKIDDILRTLCIEDKYKKFLLYPDDIMSKKSITIGEILKIKRIEKGYKLNDLQSLTGLSISSISCMESGRRTFTKKAYSKIGEILDISSEDFRLMCSSGRKMYMVYSIDVKYKVPIIKQIFMSEAKAKDYRAKLVKEQGNVLWRIKEYDIESRVPVHSSKIVQ